MSRNPYGPVDGNDGYGRPSASGSDPRRPYDSFDHEDDEMWEGGDREAPGVQNVLVVVNRTQPVVEARIVASFVASAQHTSLVEELLSSDVEVLPQKRYTTVGANGALHFVGDYKQRTFIAITSSGYPGRVAHVMLEELQDSFLLSPAGQASLTAGPGELSAETRVMFQQLVSKYDDPAQVDRLTQVQGKVEVTTTKMQENISLLFENDQKIQDIEQKSDHLTASAGKFEKSSKKLKTKMYYRKAMYLCVFLIILACILVPIILWAKSGSEATQAVTSTGQAIGGSSGGDNGPITDGPQTDDRAPVAVNDE